MWAPKPIMDIWRQFDHVPAENLTYTWWRRTARDSAVQRAVPLMEAHHAAHGSGGDAFDLAIWLLAKFRAAGILANPVAPPADLDPGKTSDAIAVVAKDRFGRSYFCDLGEQWFQPILVSPRNPEFTADFLAGFDPGAEVSIQVVEKRCTITRRVRVCAGDAGNDAEDAGEFRVDHRVFNLRGISPEELIERAEAASSRSAKTPWIRHRLMHPQRSERGVWFWTPEEVSWRLPAGEIGERLNRGPGNMAGWAAEIAQRSGLSRKIVAEALAAWAEASATSR